MRLNVSAIIFSAILILPASPAGAQFGLPQQLPQSDFVWTWGSGMNRGGISDFSIIGFDQRFRCQLDGRFGVGAGFGMSEGRNLESQLRASMLFIQDVTYTMNALDSRGQLDWATLDCKIPVVEESEDKIAEREARALERAQRARERRRAERAREEED